MNELEQRKSNLLAEAEAALDVGNVELFDILEVRIVNVNSLIRYAAAEAADNERPTSAAWDAVKAMAGG